jgi:hypothetical protein
MLGLDLKTVTRQAQAHTCFRVFQCPHPFSEISEIYGPGRLAGVHQSQTPGSRGSLTRSTVRAPERVRWQTNTSGALPHNLDLGRGYHRHYGILDGGKLLLRSVSSFRQLDH